MELYLFSPVYDLMADTGKTLEHDIYLVWTFVNLCVLIYCVCIVVLHTLVAGLLARIQYSEGPATGHLGTGFSWFPCVYKQMLRWFPRLKICYCMLLM